ncbi:MAG: type IV secretion system protein VirB3 [Alphaproteobacteria bacterium]|nr:MAG: type IV secretion system protein VirB3 [Alphaproteobacteria bacterium]TAF13194.1 MAG: type IV secretion system protein VirB3 [Alphaproteobacteria bacterium]TAF40226.1 MAG: type IV secretion system protein VirB3 [Alphaproteobacteria bacterium]TAF77356.1 MAG: type IV secretion system protein VirB3 [Alphaproteobacteria bacterium]
MAGTGRLQSDPLFQALARPVMIAGVSYLYFVLNAMMSMIVFIHSNDFLMLIVIGPAIHAVGYLICMKEPRAVELMVLRGKFGYKSYNNLFGFHFNANSYDVF